MRGKKLTTQQFIEKAKQVHGDTYDYSLVEYVNTETKVQIICKEHGDFEQTPHNHLSNKQKCPKCKGENNAKRCSSNKNIFIEKASKTHCNKYSYDKVVYKNNKTKVTILCSIHGDFEQTPNNHLRKHGCPECGKEVTIRKNRENPMGWSTSDWNRAANRSKVFDSFKVYIIKCWNEEEEFYKIGKTFSTVNYRFKCKKEMPYNYEIVKIFKGAAEEMSKLEKLLQKDNKINKYVPKVKFLGAQECFKQVNYGK